MPTHKDWKHLVRRRMLKTGESYTAARAQLLNSRAAAAAISPKSKMPDYAQLAGMSDAALAAKTSGPWAHWVKTLDHIEAHTWSHGKIAKYVHDEHEISAWWAQAVAVGYERIRGLREIGQKRSGVFEATKSRTFKVAVASLYRAFTVARARARWLPGAKLTVRKATLKSVRITWDDGTPVEASLTVKGTDKSAVQIQHGKLLDRATATRMKAFWAERLEALSEELKE